MLAMSLTGSSNGVEMDGLRNARARFSLVLFAWCLEFTGGAMDDVLQNL